MKSSYLIVFAVFSISMLISIDFYKLAYAVTIVGFPTGVAGDVNSVIRHSTGHLISVQNTGNTLRVYDYDGTTATFTNSIATAGAGEALHIDSLTNRVYYTDRGAQIAELDTSLNFFSRSVTASIECGDITLRSIESAFYCVDSTNDAIDKWDYSGSSFTETNGATLNGGAVPCDIPVQITNGGLLDDIIFVACSGSTTGIIAIEDASTSTDGFTAITAKYNVDVDGGALAWDSEHDNLLYCEQSGTDCTLLDYNFSTNTFTLISAFTLSNGVRQSCMIYDPNHDRFMVCTISGDDRVRYIDTFDGDILGEAGFSSLATAQGLIQIFNSNEFWIGSGSADADMWRFDNTGLLDGSSGSGGTTPPPSDTGGTDCTLPANANILICRLGGDNNFGGIGNATGTGLLNLGCNVIFVDCTDTNPQTNGLGLLAFIASLFVIIGMFYYTIGKEAFHMPIFIWIVIVIALSAFFTIAGWIDPIFLILSIIAVVALAVPKIINITRGNTFGSGSSE